MADRLKKKLEKKIFSFTEKGWDVNIVNDKVEVYSPNGNEWNYARVALSRDGKNGLHGEAREAYKILTFSRIHYENYPEYWKDNFDENRVA